MGEGCDPRVARSREAVLGATVELLREQGYAGVSIDGISRRSGVARTTIYRHFDSVAAIVLSALGCLRCTNAAEPTDDPVDDLRQLLRGIIASLQSGLLPLVIEAANRDPEFASLRQEFGAERWAEARSIITRIIDTGRIDARTDAGLMTDLVVAPIFYRTLLSGDPVDDDLVEAIIDHLLAGSPVAAR